jgi:CRISPR/Cas system endoribonuclease Cas6 (RAMP superfamily)
MRYTYRFCQRRTDMADQRATLARYLGLGIAVGIGLGAALDNYGVGVGIGIVIGFAFFHKRRY